MTPWQRVRPKSLYVSPILPAQSPEQEPIQAPAPTPTPTPIPAVPDNLPVVDPPVIKTTSTGTDVTLDFVLPIESDNLPLTGPKAYCAKPDVVHNIIDALNSTDAVRSANQIVIDFLHSETTKIDVEGKTFSCHGTANISNGQMLTGTFSITNNGAGDSIWKWMNDPAAPASNQQASQEPTGPNAGDDQSTHAPADNDGAQTSPNDTSPAQAPPVESGGINPIEALLVCLLALYFLPSIVALMRGRFASVFVVNLFLGWTLVGWVAALAWALAPNNSPVKRKRPLFEVRKTIPTPVNRVLTTIHQAPDGIETDLRKGEVVVLRRLDDARWAVFTEAGILGYLDAEAAKVVDFRTDAFGKPSAKVIAADEGGIDLEIVFPARPN